MRKAERERRRMNKGRRESNRGIEKRGRIKGEKEFKKGMEERGEGKEIEK